MLVPEVEIFQCDQVAKSMAVLLLTQGWAEYEAEFGDGLMPFSWDDKLLFAVSGGTVVGVLCWTEMKWRKETYITFGYVAPAWRRKGIYTRLYKALRAIAKEAGMMTVAGGVSPDNDAMRLAAISQGRVVSAITYREVLGEAPVVKIEEIGS